MQIVVIGSGAAGTFAAFTIKELNKRPDIKIFSTELYPAYSPCVLPQYLSGALDRQMVFLKSFDDYRQQRITTFFGEKVVSISIDNKMMFSERQSVPYDRLIIATGSRPVVPSLPGVDKNGVFLIKSLRDADEILNCPWDRAVVVGSGPIGVEISAALKRRGGMVYLLELENQIMPRVFDEGPASLLQKHLEEHGVRVLTGEAALEIQGVQKVQKLLTTKQAIYCDLVVLAAGVVPEIEVAKQAGLIIGELGGIKVDAQMMTSIPDIYACGDCIEVEDLLTHKPKLSLKWYDARLQAEVAASNCVGKHREYRGSYEVTNLDLFDVHAVSIGSPESLLQHKRNGLEIIERIGDRHYHRFLVVDGRLMGAQLVGRSDYVGSILSAMIRGDDISYIRGLVGSGNLIMVPSMLLANNYLGREFVLSAMANSKR